MTAFPCTLPLTQSRNGGEIQNLCDSASDEMLRLLLVVKSTNSVAHSYTMTFTMRILPGSTMEPRSSITSYCRGHGQIDQCMPDSYDFASQLYGLRSTTPYFVRRPEEFIRSSSNANCDGPGQQPCEKMPVTIVALLNFLALVAVGMLWYHSGTKEELVVVRSPRA